MDKLPKKIIDDMKFLHKVMLFVGLASFVALNTQTTYAQTRDLTVTVTDANGPVIGASVMVKGTTTGDNSDVNGVVKLSNVASDATIEVSFIGYVTQEIPVNNRSAIDVTLVEDAKVVEDVVVVGFGTQKKESLTSAISNISAEDIVSTRQTDVVASLQGKVPGLLIRQQSGMPGDYDSKMSMRGYGEPMVVIDGVVRTATRRDTNWGSFSDSGTALLAQMNPDDIESISVLKDASASIYGIGSENGVILVTTKKGTAGRPTVNYSANLAFGVPTAMPEQVDIVTYMNIRNEMLTNSRKPILYSDDFIAHYENGDPGYVDTDWYKAVMNKFQFDHTHNVSLRGGSEQTNYFISGQFTDNTSLLKADNLKANRYSLRANVTTNISDQVSATLSTSFNTMDQMTMNFNQNLNFFYYVALADRTLAPTVYNNPDHYTYLATSEGRNPVALMQPENGYSRNQSNAFNNNLDVKWTPDFLKGLTVQVSGAYDVNSRNSSSLTRAFAQYDYWTDVQMVNNADANSYEESWNKSQRLYGRVQANYNGTFGDHRVGATLAAEATKNIMNSLGGSRQFGDFFTHDILNQGDSSTASNSGTRSMSATAGYIGRVNYDYKGKYLVELMARYDGTYVYAPGYRWGLFPSYSLGWRASEEPFIKDNMPWLDNLKFRWSDGKTGQRQGQPYQYLLGYTSGSSWVFDDGGQILSYGNTSVAETLLSWADVRMMNFGVDWEINRGIFGGSIDIFKRAISGTAATSTNTVPDFYGLSLPQQNLNKSENVGIDLVLTHRHNIGEFNYRVNATVTYARSRTTYREADKTAQYTSAQNYWSNYTTGRWNGARDYSRYEWAGGQFTGWEDINSSPVLYDIGNSMNNMLPGMYKLEDRNGNGLIDGQDVYYRWGEGNAPLQFGLMLSGNYKSFDFSANFAGASLVSKSVSLSGAMGFGFFSAYYKNYLDRWTPVEAGADPFDPQTEWKSGFWPAVAVATSAYDGSSNSTYRVNQPYNAVDGTYLRLKSLEVGYTLPRNLTQKIGIRSARVFLSGTNLLTFCNKLLKPYDPERNENAWLGAGGYPLMRTYSLGVNLSF